MFKKILLATDGSKNSKTAVTKAIEISKEFRCQLIVVSIADVTDEFKAIAPDLEEKLIITTKKNVNNVIKQAEKAGIKAIGVVRSGEPYVQITKIAKANKTDLIVMGSHGRTGIKRFLMGSVTSGVIGHTTSSVLVVKS